MDGDLNTIPTVVYIRVLGGIGMDAHAILQ